MNVVALDIDGVLNRFAGLCKHSGPWINPECLGQLDRLLAATDANVVVSSGWRQPVLSGDMTLGGFRWMMMTHGMRGHGRIVGVTPRRADLGVRGAEIRDWWRANPQFDRLVALDDMDLGHAEWGIPLVQTDYRVGLTAAYADRAIAILMGKVNILVEGSASGWWSWPSDKFRPSGPEPHLCVEITPTDEPSEGGSRP